MALTHFIQFQTRCQQCLQWTVVQMLGDSRLRRSSEAIASETS